MQKFIVLLLAVLLLQACHRDHTPYGDNKTAGRYYRIRGMQMYCEVYGQGRPLLMIHGNGGSISTFSRNIGYFAQNYRVIVADSRAQGRSADTRDSLTFEQMADDCADLLDSVHAPRACVLGWSDGGITALLMAIRHPAKVEKMAVSGANLWPGSTALVPAGWHDLQKEYAVAKSGAAKTAAQKQHDKLVRLDAEQPHIDLGQLHNIKCPVLVICGEYDIIRREHTQLIYNNLLYANLWVIPRDDHYTISEHVSAFNQRIDEFFGKRFHE
ncbi:hypothetical protein BEL04_14700 [Mucilaginibacter sp. PPCGB 2223]|uniref:alpha/beta fold hydrolase n=1 Tax=Mucilaginibacter sp. PPCGB 2223 TaxID=1886027 RepID=UPI00082480B2|nr:alpha/beta hydrolase [Mucilaginibacter sp. PPCGB 2223]OCX52692.1 hypothetical protein BEL04_14700 [Mucilaginibacter sp. PPCGB 2223]